MKKELSVRGFVYLEMEEDETQDEAYERLQKLLREAGIDSQLFEVEVNEY